MKTIQIQVISVGPKQRVPTAKGGYHTIEVAYRDDGKVNGKKLVDFANPGLFEQVEELKQGDNLEVDIEKVPGKDGREFWQWQAVRKVDGGVEKQSSPQPGVAVAQSAKPVGKVLGSTYETAEERARRQVLIVRQSSITAALGFIKLNDGTADVSEILSIASQFEEYVFNGKDKSKKDASQASISKAGAANPVATGQEQVGPVRGLGSESQAKRIKQQKEVVADEEDSLPF